MKVKSLYTRAYHGTLVKDYGFHRVMKRLRKRYPSFSFDSDAPAVVHRKYNPDIGHIRKMTIREGMLGKEFEVKAIFSSAEKQWKFFNTEGNYFNLTGYLRLKKKRR